MISIKKKAPKFPIMIDKKSRLFFVYNKKKVRLKKGKSYIKRWLFIGKQTALLCSKRIL